MSRKILENFSGELMDTIDTVKGEEKFIGTMSENAKKLLTLYNRVTKKRGEIFIEYDHQNPYLTQAQPTRDAVAARFQLDEKVPWRRKKEVDKLLRYSNTLRKALEFQVCQDYPEYNNHNFLFTKGWKIWDDGPKPKKSSIPQRMRALLKLNS